MFLGLIEIIVLMILGGLFELDRTSVVQSLVSEPIIIGPLAGFVVGEPILGVKAGVLMQLFFLGTASIGGSTPPDGSLAALVVVGSAGLAHVSPLISNDALTGGAVLLLMIPASRLGRAIDGLLKEKNVKLAHEADARVTKEGASAIDEIVHKRIFASFAIWALVVGASVGAGAVILKLLSRLATTEILYALEATGRLLPLVAAGAALSAIKLRRANILYAAWCVVFLIVSVVVK